MDTLVGYVTYIFDDHTVKVHIVDQAISNQRSYAPEERLRVQGWEALAIENEQDLKAVLMHHLLYKKIRVKVDRMDTVLGLEGEVEVLPEYAA